MAGPLGRIQQRAVAQIVDTFYFLKIIDTMLLVDAEQEVPKINLQDRIPQRTVLRALQMVEQLFKVVCRLTARRW